MAVIQVPMSISEEALTGLLNGNLVRTGGVVRDNSGHIVEHLKDMSKKKAASQTKQIVSQPKSLSMVKGEGSIKNRVSSYATKNKSKTVLIVGGVISIGVGVCYGVSRVLKKKNLVEKIEVSGNSEFNSALNDYMNAAKNGSLNLELITGLQSQLSMINAEDSSLIMVDVKLLQELLSYILRNTDELAQVNSYHIKEEQKQMETDSYIIKLEKALEIQKEIFEKSA